MKHSTAFVLHITFFLTELSNFITGGQFVSSMDKVHKGDKLQASHVWQVGGRESGWMVGWEVAQMLVVKSEKRMVLLMNATATRANVCSQTFFSRGCVIMNRQPPTTLPWTTSGDVYIRRTSRSRGMPSVLIIEATRIKWFLHETNWERTKTENEIRILAWGGEESQRERERERERERKGEATKNGI